MKKRVCYFCGLKIDKENLEECPYCEENYCNEHIETHNHDCPLTPIQNPFEIYNQFDKDDIAINEYISQNKQNDENYNPTDGNLFQNLNDFTIIKDDKNSNYEDQILQNENNLLGKNALKDVRSYLDNGGSPNLLANWIKFTPGILEKLLDDSLINKNRDEYENNLAIFDILIKSEQLRDNPRGIAFFQKQMGQIHLKWGDYTLALEAHEDALSTLERHPSLELELSIRMGLGVCYSNKENESNALIHYFKALEICQTLNDDLHEIRILHNIATSYLVMGDMDQALAFYEDNLDRLKSSDSKDIKTKIITMNQIGLIYAKKGFHLEAKQQFDRSLKIAELIQAKEEKAHFMNVTAMWHAKERGDFEWAMKILNLAKDIAEECADHITLAYINRNLGSCYLAQKLVDNALDHYQKAIAIFYRAEDYENIEDLENKINICNKIINDKIF